MGTVYRLSCKKCGYKLDAGLGSSGFFHYDEQILNNVLNGKYGEEIQKLVKEKQVELITFASSIRILIKCRDCGHFEVVPKLIIRKNNDLVEYQHKCKICGGEVESFDANALDRISIHLFDRFIDDEKVKRNKGNIKLECPNCHEELVVMWAGTWD